MAKLAYLLSGGAPIVKRCKIAATMSTAGIPVELAVAGEAGINLPGTTQTWTDAVGVTLDTGTYSTTQGDAEGLVSVIINPQAVYRLLMVQNGAGDQLTLTTNSAVSAAGTVITITTGDPAPNSPTHDEGMALCVTGANVGQTRKITSVAATTATVTVPFLNDLAVGDVFIHVPWSPWDVTNNNLEVSNTQQSAQVETATGTGQPWRVIDLDFDVSSQTNARRNSHVHAIMEDHILQGAAT